MPRFSVTWQTVVVAGTAEEAAKQAAEEEPFALHTVNLTTGEKRCVLLVPMERGEE